MQVKKSRSTEMIATRPVVYKIRTQIRTILAIITGLFHPNTSNFSKGSRTTINTNAIDVGAVKIPPACHPLRFILKKGTPGLKATKIENKIGLRCVQNGDMLLKGVFVADEDRLPGINSFQDTSKVLAVSRIMVAWQPIGIAMGVYDMCHRYLQEWKQFGASLNSFQINQEKLVCMLGNIQAMSLMGWRLCKLYEAGKMTLGHASLAKAWNTLQARETVSLGRELLGGNGILSDFLVAKAKAAGVTIGSNTQGIDLEAILTFDGLDITTNNLVEYVAVIKGLKLAKRHGVKSLLIKGDSKLIINQLSGNWTKGTWSLEESFDEAHGLLRHFEAMRIDGEVCDSMSATIMKESPTVLLHSRIFHPFTNCAGLPHISQAISILLTSSWAFNIEELLELQGFIDRNQGPILAEGCRPSRHHNEHSRHA
eukprot:Gb_32152 [translate_table: standard]